jgi:hypothetical protein
LFEKIKDKKTTLVKRITHEYVLLNLIDIFFNLEKLSKIKIIKNKLYKRMNGYLKRGIAVLYIKRREIRVNIPILNLYFFIVNLNIDVEYILII